MFGTKIKYSIKLYSLNHHFQRKRNIIIHHGLMGSSKNFRNISKTPSFSNYCNAFLLDSRNHGDSPHADSHRLQDLADDVHEFILNNNLNNSQNKLTLMGHSMGALALLQFTKRYASSQIQNYIDRIIIIDIPATPINTFPNYIEMSGMLKRLLQIDLKKSKEYIYKAIDERALNQSIASLLKTNIKQINEQQYKWVVNMKVLANEGYYNISNFDLSTNNKKQWKKPVEVIYGQNSGYFNQNQYNVYRQYFPQMEDNNFHQVPNAGHWVHFDQTKIFLEIIDKIMKRDSPK